MSMMFEQRSAACLLHLIRLKDLLLQLTTPTPTATAQVRQRHRQQPQAHYGQS